MKNLLLLRFFLITIIFTITTACSLFKNSQNSNNQIILAHGGSTGYSGYNSPEAIKYSLNNLKTDGIEVDVQLTKDFIPVIAHDPWIDRNYCQRNDGQAMHYHLIKDLNFNELLKHYQCAYPHKVSKKSKKHALMSLKEVLELMTKHPKRHLYLDIKIQDHLTHSHEEYSRAINELLDKSNIQNHIYIEVPTIHASKYFRNSISYRPYELVLSYPPFYAGDNWHNVATKEFIRNSYQSKRATKRALAGNVDILMTPIFLLTPYSISKLKQFNIKHGAFMIEPFSDYYSRCSKETSLLIVDDIKHTRCN